MSNEGSLDTAPEAEHRHTLSSLKHVLASCVRVVLAEETGVQPSGCSSPSEYKKSVTTAQAAAYFWMETWPLVRMKVMLVQVWACGWFGLGLSNPPGTSSESSKAT